MPDNLNSAGFVVYRQSEGGPAEFLLLKSSGLKSRWHVPKGRREKGETIWDNAVRELEEETGLVASRDLDVILDFETVIQYKVRQGMKTVTCYLGRLKDFDKEVVLSHEHVSLQWNELEATQRLAGYESMQGMFEKSAERINTMCQHV